MKDKLTDLVQRGIDGGCDIRKFSPAYKEWTLRSWFLTSNSPPIVMLCVNHPTLNIRRGYNLNASDLYNDRGFMEAVYQGSNKCNVKGCIFNDNSCENGCSQHKEIIRCAISPATKWFRAGVNATKLTLTEGIESAVNYLWEEMDK